MAILNDSVRIEDFKKFFVGSLENIGKQYKTNGEVLWVSGKQKEALGIWNKALKKSPKDSKIIETMKRFNQH